MQQTLELWWDGKKIGTILQASVDNFFIYGRWNQQCDDNEYKNMLMSLDLNGEVLVELRGKEPYLKGLLLVEPEEEEIEIRLDPSLNS